MRPGAYLLPNSVTVDHIIAEVARIMVRKTLSERERRGTVERRGAQVRRAR